MGHPDPALFRFAPFCAGLALLAGALFDGCSDRPQDRAAPVPLDARLAVPVEAEGVRFQAQALDDGQQATAALGFDARRAGLLPLRISIGNQGGGAVKIVPRQTFLIDADGQAWPLLTSAQALARLGRVGVQAATSVHAPGPGELETFTAFALDLLAGAAFSSEADAGSRAGQNLAGRSQRNPIVQPGQVASGVLFFPGQEEVKGVRSLRLCYEQAGRGKFLTLPLQTSPPSSGAK